MTHTLRLIAPDWQSGNREAYYYGAEILRHLIPNTSNQKERRINITEPREANKLEQKNHVFGQDQVIDYVNQAQTILDEEQPDKIITFGGNCLVSQAPFDYLHGKYGDELGVIWIDTHPDISTPQDIPNEHAMVVANLIGQGDPKVDQLVHHQFVPNQFLYVGLQQMLEPEVNHLNQLKFNYSVQDDTIINYEQIQQWINDNNFTKIAIHFDIDVLNPDEFRSTYVAEPGLKELPTVPGKMSLSELNDILQGLSKHNDVVGLTIAEYMPWDAINLRKSLSDLDIFQ